LNGFTDTLIPSQTISKEFLPYCPFRGLGKGFDKGGMSERFLELYGKKT
jgi:hypothetical protein